jgi:hypothetical protein
MAKSITEQTGWKRPSPVAICQGFDVLRKVTEYDFDLSNLEFQNYCRARGVLYKAGCNNRFKFTADHSATKDRFFDEFRYAIEYPEGSGQRYRFTDDEMETHWKIMLAAKGAMQDCWELFRNLSARA